MKVVIPTEEPKVNIPVSNPRAIRLSDRQYSLLLAMNAADHATVGIDDVMSFNQTTLGANKRRGWVTERNRGHAMGLTMAGREVLRQFGSASFVRRVSSTRFANCLKLEVPESLLPAQKRKPLELVRKNKRAA